MGQRKRIFAKLWAAYLRAYLRRVAAEAHLAQLGYVLGPNVSET